MRFILTIGVSVFAGLVLGCSSMTIKSDFDPSANFARYKTYKWYTPKPGERPKVSTLVEKRIRAAVENELEARGFVKSQGPGTDVIVAFHARAREKVEITRDWYGWRHRRERIETYRYREGTLVIDIIDPQMNQLVWRGWAVGVVSAKSRSEDKINEAVAKIFERYPR